MSDEAKDRPDVGNEYGAEENGGVQARAIQILKSKGRSEVEIKLCICSLEPSRMLERWTYTCKLMHQLVTSELTTHPKVLLVTGDWWLW